MIWPFILIQVSEAVEVYSWRNSNGTTVYSDQPQNGARKIQIEPGYSYYAIQYVYDGDTVRLQNGESIRLLGINTPEVANKNNPAQAGGAAAANWLKQYLSGKKVRLEKDQERKDKYQRTLAYLISEHGENINLTLVRKGYAFVNIYPPNLAYAEQLQTAQQQAQLDNLGIWQLPAYAVLPAEKISIANYRGWHRISGMVKKLEIKRKYAYLSLQANIKVQIPLRFLAYFPKLSEYVNKQVVVSGWPKRKGESFVIYLRHVSAIALLE